MLELALKIISEAFKGKLDKAGVPYVEHLFRVADAVQAEYVKKGYSYTEELQCIALLHDLLEDCHEWNEKSLSCLFNARVVAGVVALTHTSNLDYFSYISQVLENGDAIRVKLCDLRDNMDVTRLKELTAKDFERLNKYVKSYHRLLA